MRFRQQQDDAHRATTRLLLLFGLLLIGLVLAVNLALWGVWHGLTALMSVSWPLPPLFFETNSLVVLMFVIGGALVELGRLRAGGGTHVAVWAGGRALNDSRTLAERRLLNIVDEMAIASALPRPAVYLLEQEDAINAFTAGWTHDDAVIAVTQGALERLTRDELQGLVAHEFGHIHHHDLRLNMQLLALVWGLSLVHGYGHSLLEADEDTGHRSPFGLLVGPVFVAAGLLGWLAGQLLQAAVSRQRELLADASAVQFTRSRDGLGGVLRKVWHQALRHDDRLRRVPARLLAAMLLQAPADWLATHPPLPERLRRLYGRDCQPLPAPRLKEPEGDAPTRTTRTTTTASVMPPAAMALVPQGGPRLHTPAPPPSSALAGSPLPAGPATPAFAPRPGDTSRPPEPQARSNADETDATARLSRLHGPGELRAAILALLLTPDSQRERRAWQEETKGLSSAAQVLRDVRALGPALRLPWLDQLLQRVAQAPLLDRQTLLVSARRVMSGDGHTRPIDRLVWLWMRQCLGDAPVTPAARSGAPPTDLTHTPLASRQAVARLSAFLSRLVPQGDAWYDSVMQPWWGHEAAPACEPPDPDGLVHALQETQALPWMVKPVLARGWVHAARTHSPPGPLPDTTCEALRLACRLIDSPLPPELARHFVELDAAPTP